MSSEDNLTDITEIGQLVDGGISVFSLLSKLNKRHVEIVQALRSKILRQESLPKRLWVVYECRDTTFYAKDRPLFIISASPDEIKEFLSYLEHSHPFSSNRQFDGTKREVWCLPAILEGPDQYKKIEREAADRYFESRIKSDAVAAIRTNPSYLYSPQPNQATETDEPH